jgi:hypothetical protein
MFHQPPILIDQMANNLAVVAAVQLFARHTKPKIRVRRYNQLLGAFAKLRKATISFVVSARLSGRPTVWPFTWNNSAPTGRIFMKSDI